MKTRGKGNTRRKNTRIWKCALLAPIIIICAAAVVSIGVVKGIWQWHTASWLMRTIVGLACGTTLLHYCMKESNNTWPITIWVVSGSVILLLICEAACGGDAGWNPIPGLMACGLGCTVGLLWSLQKQPQRRKRRSK